MSNKLTIPKIIHEDFDLALQKTVIGCKHLSNCLPVPSFDEKILKDDKHIYYLILAYPFNKKVVSPKSTFAPSSPIPRSTSSFM